MQEFSARALAGRHRALTEAPRRYIYWAGTVCLRGHHKIPPESHSVQHKLVPYL